jgi:hypothetical protein
MRPAIAAPVLLSSALLLAGCKSTEPPPEPPPYCTRSLGVVDCWQTGALPRPLPPEVADGPRTLTPEQERDRTQRWPGL